MNNLPKKPFFQLTTKNGKPTFYTFFDNMDLTERLHVSVMIYHLNSEEYRKVTKKINTVHGKQSIDANEPLEFMKYVIINWKGEISVVDMDTLSYVSVDECQSLNKHLKQRNPQQGDKLRRLTSKYKLLDGPSLHRGDSSLHRARLIFETLLHGNITLTFNTFTDPNVRNGLQINVGKNLTKSNMYGALVYATHPKYLLLKSATKLPAIPTKKKLEEMQNSKYWVEDETPKKYMNQENSDAILVPRGKIKQKWDEF